MDIEGIADFIVLAETRSFSRAAEARFVTQPAFSRRIKAIEEKIGAALVDRSVTPVALTPAGERFLAYARSLAEIMEKAQEDVQSRVSALENPVHLALPPSLSVTFFPFWYKSLQRKIPGLTLRLSTESASRCVAELRKGLADFALVLTAEGVGACYDLTGLESRETGQDALVAVRAPHARQDSCGLLGYPRNSYMDSCAQALLGKRKMKTIFESPSAELLRAMALAGFGVAVLQESMVEDDMREGFLVPAFKEAGKLHCRILLLRPARKMERKAEALWVQAGK